jgi:hypothetical protein
MGDKQTWQVLGEDEVHYGPYTAEQLMAFAQDGTIDRDSMVWTEGLEEWIPAGQVEGLFPLQVAAPLTAPPQGPQFVLTGQPRQSPIVQPKGVAWAAPPAGPPAVEIDGSFSQVVTGLRLVYWGFLVNFLATLAHTVLDVIQESEFSGTGGGASGVAIVLLLVALVSYVTEVVGVCLCFKPPQDSKARGFLTAAVVIMVMPFIGVLSILVSASGVILVPIGWVLYPLAVLFYVLYMKRLAVLVGKRDLELRAKSFGGYLMFIFGLAVFGLIIFVLAITGVVMTGSVEGVIGLLIGVVVGWIGAVVLLVMAIVGLFLYLGLLRAFREGIQLEVFGWKSGRGQAAGPSLALR